MTVDTSHQT